MSTNKTRLFISEFGGTRGPYNAVTEFDIYQEAYDYAYKSVDLLGGQSYGSYDMFIWLYSYDNTSYRFGWLNGSVSIVEISFP